MSNTSAQKYIDIDMYTIKKNNVIVKLSKGEEEGK